MTPQGNDGMDGAGRGEESGEHAEQARRLNEEVAQADEVPLPETVIGGEWVRKDEDAVGQADSGTGGAAVEEHSGPETPWEEPGTEVEEGAEVAEAGAVQGAAAEAPVVGSLTLEVERSTLDVGRLGETNEERSTSNVELPTSNGAANAEVASRVPSRRRRVLSGGWTMALLLSGIGLIAACVLIPQGDETRKLMYERERLRQDLEQVQKQVATNEEFLKRVQDDPTLAQRLAQRQMKLVPAGTAVLDVDASPTKDDKSPFLIVSVPKPAPMPEFRPRGGWFSEKCRDGRSQLYMIGAGLMLVAAGLVLGASGPRD